MMHGLGLLDRSERAAFRTLPLSAQLLILDELAYDPSQAEAIKELLRERDPERAIADQIAAEITSAVYGIPLSEVGMGRSLKKAFKKVKEKAKAAVKRIKDDPRKMAALVLAGSTGGISLIALQTKAGKKILQKAAEYGRTYGPTALSIAGIIAAPFTGGASMAVPALIQARTQIQKQKAAAKEMEKVSKEEAAALEAQAAEAERQLLAQVEEIYQGARQVFEQAGYDADRWASMTLDQKQAAIEALAKAGEAAASDAVSGAADAQDTAVGAPWDAPIIRPPHPSDAPVGKYDLVVEGQTVATAPTMGEITAKIESMTKPGDRFEVLFGGQSTGLKIRTGSGVISVPASDVAKVRGLTTDEVKGVVSRAEESASAKKGGFPIWLLAAPVAIYAATR
jgi:hypothetical protein